MPLETPRLLLEPYAPGHLLALLDGPEAFARAFGRRAAEGLGDFLTSGDVAPEWLAMLRASTEPDPWRHGFAVVERASGLVVGGAMFKGPPDAEGVVEIAYGLVPAFQGRGYATEAAGALVRFAFGHDAVRLVRAHTLRENNASARVLSKCGFRRVGDVVDPEDGPVWRWELPRPAG